FAFRHDLLRQARAELVVPLDPIGPSLLDGGYAVALAGQRKVKPRGNAEVRADLVKEHFPSARATGDTDDLARGERLLGGDRPVQHLARLGLRSLGRGKARDR